MWRAIARPLIRNLIHHNKVTNSLLSLQDFGGIASWQIGPAYVYNNISGNAVGYKHVHWRRFQEGEWKLGKTRAENWHRRSCYGIRIYVDGKPHNGPWSGTMDADTSLSNTADFTVGMTRIGVAGTRKEDRYFAGQIDFLRVARGTLADAETTIEALYRWEFDGPSQEDFLGHRPVGRCRDAGAIEFTGQ